MEKWQLVFPSRQPSSPLSTQNPLVLVKHSITVLPHQTYSPDLARCDFSRSQNFKNPSNEENVRRFRKLTQMRRSSWKPSQKKRTRTVSRSGNTIGISVHLGESTFLLPQSAHLLNRPRISCYWMNEWKWKYKRIKLCFMKNNVMLNFRKSNTWNEYRNLICY